MARKLVVEIVGDASSLERSFKRADRSAKEFDRNMSAASRGAIAGSGAFAGLGRSVAFASAGFLGGVGLTAAIKSTVVGASDLEQQIGKTNVVFDESAAAVIAWSRDLADSFGLSQRAALEVASSFGALFAPIGLVGDEAARQSQKLTELGADLASFYNTDVASALDAIRSGLVGESEPLRKYGVLLSETRVQQEALNETGKKNVANLTDQEKVLARISLIFKDSKVAQGDFRRTSDQAAQQVKIFQANLENLKNELGQGLVPALAGATSALNDFFAAIKPGSKSKLRFLNESGLQNLQDLSENLPGPLGRFSERNRLPFTAPNRPPERPPVRAPAGILGPVTRDEIQATKAVAETAKEARERVARLREAREATRQETDERARLAVERTALTDSVADDIAALRRLNALLARRIRGGHDVIANEREQISVQLQINALLEQQAQAREEAARKAREARDARQFRLLGFGPGGEELVPGVKNLKAQLAGVRDAIEGSFLDTRKTRGLLGHIRQVLSGGLGSVSADVRRRIQEILADLRNQLKRSSVDVTRFQHSAQGQLTLAGAHPNVGRGIVITGGVHLHGVQSVQDMENQLAKRRKQRARQRRSTR